MQRSVFTNDGRVLKNNSCVEFGLELTLDEFCVGFGGEYFDGVKSIWKDDRVDEQKGEDKNNVDGMEEPVKNDIQDEKVENESDEGVSKDNDQENNDNETALVQGADGPTLEICDTPSPNEIEKPTPSPSEEPDGPTLEICDTQSPNEIEETTPSSPNEIEEPTPSPSEIEEPDGPTLNICDTSSPNEIEPTPYNKQIEEPNAVKLPINPPSVRYTLKAVVLHYGTHEQGHFICFQKNQSNWWRISDCNIALVRDVREELLEHGSGYVYLLFYERI